MPRRALTERQRRVYEGGGVPEEQKAIEWLRRHRFRHIEGFDHRHAGYWDIKAERDGKRWNIEVKSSYGRGEPKVNIANLIMMIKEKGIDKVGILFMPGEGETPLLFELSNMSYAGLRASDSKGKEVERKAAKKAWETRGNSTDE